MKKMYILLLGLVCSAAVIAQTTEWTDATTENAATEEMTIENMLPEESGQMMISDELMADIQQDCQLLAQHEGVEEEHVLGFVEVCVADNVAMEQMAGQEEMPETEIITEEYAEVLVEEEPIPTVTE